MSATPQDLAEYAVDSSNAADCIVAVEQASAVNLRWANSSLTTNGSLTALQATVVAIDGPRSVSVAGPASTRADIDALLEQAEAGLHAASIAEDASPLVSGAADADWTDPPGATAPAIFDGVIEALADSFDPTDHLQYGFVSHDITTTYLASSTGLRRRHAQPTGHYGVTARTPDGSASSWVGGATPDFSLDFAQPLADLRARLRWGARHIDLPAGRYDTILPPSAVADLMIDAYWSASAREALDGQTVYATPEGAIRWDEQLARPGVNLFSDPTGGVYSSLRATPFVVESRSSAMGSVYDNGLGLARTHWLRDGRLDALIQTQHTAQLTDRSPTPGVDNLILEIDGAQGGLDDLVAGMPDGLLLTCLWYIREVDPQTLLLTGVTRDGVYKIEGGEIVGVVNNFRFNESPLDLLRRFSVASETTPTFGREWGEDYFSRTAMPALRVPDFNMSSVSQAR
ncbi:MAG: metallopeptidase TldD-related protein [Marmoricola sp.]